MLSNNKIEAILSKIRSAAKPPKFTYELLKQLGFPSSNDRAVIPLLKKMGFMTEDGVPTSYYDRLRDHSDWQFVLGERVKDLYQDLYSVDTQIHKKSDVDIKGTISRITGKDVATAGRYFNTFKTLASLSKFEDSPKPKEKNLPPLAEDDDSNKKPKNSDHERKEPSASSSTGELSFHHNIEIHLPATTDVAVYNAIFKSLRENLLG